MPLPDGLLNPIPGQKPGGENLYYAPVYDKVKEARREDDEAPQGDWERERKKADYPLVLKLCGEALANKSKDLQLAAWLTEALLKYEGFAGLRSGLDLLRGLIETFWDSLYPEIEDGDAERRAAPLDWVGTRLGDAVKRVPLTRSGLDWLKYRESRTVGYEADCEANETKQQARAQAIADGKLTPEEFDTAVASTSKTSYEQALDAIDSCLSAADALDETCGGKFGDFQPSFEPLRESLREVRQTVNTLLTKKRALEPAAQSSPAAERVTDVISIEEVSSSGAAAAPARAPMPSVKPVTLEPSDRADAFSRVEAAARFLRSEEASNPVPYLLLRALRWGELRANSDIESSQLEAPSTEIRKQIRQLWQDCEWDKLMEAAESAMAAVCGRGWLDLQRYTFRAAEEQGNTQVAKAIRSELKALLADYPSLPQLMLNDETPVANPDTVAWLKDLVAPPQPLQEPVREAVTLREVVPGEQPADPFDVAMQLARSGHAEEAIELLSREIAHERSGRARFHRKVELAQICMNSGFEAVAYPILEAVAAEIDERNLEEWESPEVIAHPLGMLLRCLEKLKHEPAEKQRVYARLCRLDPVQAVQFCR